MEREDIGIKDFENVSILLKKSLALLLVRSVDTYADDVKQEERELIVFRHLAKLARFFDILTGHETNLDKEVKLYALGHTIQEEIAKQNKKDTQ